MIEWIVTSSALILLVLLLRVIVKNRISPRLRYALWGLVLARLLIPGTLWESKASVLTPVMEREILQAEISAETPAPVLPFTSDSNPYPDSQKPILREPAQTHSSPPEKTASWNAVLTGIWLTGAAGTAAFLAAVNGKFAYHLKKRRELMGRFQGRAVYTAEGLTSPCLFGLLRPAIYLTPELDENERKHVLAHEYTHFRQGDHIWAVLRGVCLAVHWFNPLVWLAAGLSRRDCELSCDEGAVRLLGEACRADYGRTLVGLAVGRTAPADLVRCATTMTGGKSALKERVAVLVKQPKTTAAMAATVCLACAGCVLCTFTGAETAHAAPSARNIPIPSVDELPTKIGRYDGDYWLLDEVADADIALYCEKTGESGQSDNVYLRYGDYIQYVNQIVTPFQTYDGVLSPHLTWYDFDGDGENELLACYPGLVGENSRVDELVVYEWENGLWREHRFQPNGIIADFNQNAVFQSSGGVSQITYNGQTIQTAAGGDSCLINGEQVSYTLYGKDGWGVLMTLGGTVGPSNDGPRYTFEYACDVYYLPDGSFVTGGAKVLRSLALPEELPAPGILTPVFRRILREFISECREANAGDSSDLSENFFAVCDVNGDGSDELITVLNNAPTAGQVEQVYDADGNLLLAEYPLITYYDNGYAVAGWSHNQGRAGDKLWPYTLYQTSGSGGNRRYVRAASVDGWDCSLGENFLSSNDTRIPFPHDVDQDGDGFVYYIITEEGGYAPEYGQPVDYAGWAEWAAAYLGGNVVEPVYIRLNPENIAVIES